MSNFLKPQSLENVMHLYALKPTQVECSNAKQTLSVSHIPLAQKLCDREISRWLPRPPGSSSH